MSGGHEGQSRKVKERQQHFFIVFFSTRGSQLMSGGHEGQSRKVKEGQQQHFFSVFFFTAWRL